MSYSRKTGAVFLLMSFLFIAGFTPSVVYGHCDTMNGPVISDARAALETGDITPVLKWIKKEYEPQVAQSFRKVMEVRKINAQAKELADYSFFETVVRLHRAGEGASYTGLTTEALEPVIEQADKSIDLGSMDDLSKMLTQQVETELQLKFRSVLEKRKKAGEGVEAGREYVESYVAFVHYVESLHALSVTETATPHEHE